MLINIHKVILHVITVIRSQINSLTHIQTSQQNAGLITPSGLNCLRQNHSAIVSNLLIVVFDNGGESQTNLY
jgi:hypothetical protein